MLEHLPMWAMPFSTVAAKLSAACTRMHTHTVGLFPQVQAYIGVWYVFSPYICMMSIHKEPSLITCPALNLPDHGDFLLICMSFLPPAGPFNNQTLIAQLPLNRTEWSSLGRHFDSFPIYRGEQFLISASRSKESQDEYPGNYVFALIPQFHPILRGFCWVI